MLVKRPAVEAQITDTMHHDYALYDEGGYLAAEFIRLTAKQIRSADLIVKLVLPFLNQWESFLGPTSIRITIFQQPATRAFACAYHFIGDETPGEILKWFF